MPRKLQITIELDNVPEQDTIVPGSAFTADQHIVSEVMAWLEEGKHTTEDGVKLPWMESPLLPSSIRLNFQEA